MYVPTPFEEHNEKEITNLIEQFPLAALVCCSDGEFIVNHVPLLRESDEVYIGHFAKANPLSTLFPNGTNAIAIFNGENSYISPNWYPTKALDHRQVPTWNYQVVHLHGHIDFENSKKARMVVVGKLTRKYERLTSGSKEWKMSDAPREYLDQMLENIVAFKFIVKKITAKSKLGQNRGEKDFKAVMSAMHRIGKPVLASAMKRTNKVGTR